MKNRLLKLLINIYLLSFFISCGESVTPQHILDQPRPLLIKTTPPEIMPGEIFKAELLVAGTDFSCDSDVKVRWMDREELELSCSDPLEVHFDESILEEVSEAAELFEENDFYDIPLMASVNIETEDEHGKKANRKIKTIKTLRLWEKNRLQDDTRPFNPDIEGVKVSFISSNNELKEFLIEKDSERQHVLFKEKYLPDYIGFSGVVSPKSETNNKNFIYRWYFTKDHSKTMEKRLSVKRDKPLSYEYFKTEKSGTTNRNLLFDLHEIKEELAEKEIEQEVVFSAFLIVRDRPDNPDGIKEYRFGLDYFKLDIKIEPDNGNGRN